MAARLARCGHSVHGYDIAADRAAALTADGVRGAATIAAAVGGADVVAITVATPDQVEQVLFAAHRRPAGRPAGVSTAPRAGRRARDARDRAG
jgi:3-hydroxyisobutyrate dehydrogenase-like beta-hydroxyacid dehydrogenase